MKYTVLIWVVFFLVSCGGNDSAESVQVYIDDGAIQCEFEGSTPDETAQTLIDNGLDVIDSTCGYIVGLDVAAQCGLGDLNVNIHTIPLQSLQDAIDLGFESTDTLPQGYSQTCDQNI